MRVMICCNGLPPAGALLHQAAEWADYIIAADGGASVLLSHAIVPDAITGDMDSFSQDAFERFLKQQDENNFSTAKTPELLPNPDQESNDLEKALMLAGQSHGTHHTTLQNEVLICGATGYRLDHSLKNVSVMQQFSTRFTAIFMIDDYLCSFVHPPGKELRLSLPEATPVSLFPLSGRVEGLSTSGLKYELHDDFLENGLRDGSSNEVSAPESKTLHSASEQPAGFDEKPTEVALVPVSLSYRSGQLVVMISPLNGMRWPLLS